MFLKIPVCSWPNNSLGRFYYSLLGLIGVVSIPDREYLLFARVRRFFNFGKVIYLKNISCFWQLNVTDDDDDEADSLIKEAEGSEEEVENEDDDLLPF